MKKLNILCLGCGDLATGLMTELVRLNIPFTSSGLRRSQGHMPGFDQIVNADLLKPAQLLQALSSMAEPDIIVYTATPGDQSYKDVYYQAPLNMLNVIEQLGWQSHWLHVSSTGVFGHTHGEWVHEDTQPCPQSQRSKTLYASEQLIQSYKKSVIIRFGGIYGEGRDYLTRRLASSTNTKPVQRTPAQYSNRIHRRDAVRALAFLVNKIHHNTLQWNLYHGVDAAPVALADVAQYITACRGYPEPSWQDQAQLNQQNKRVGHRRLLQEGFSWLFPTYKCGYDNMLTNKP